MPIDYGDMVARAWKITWKNKVLWLFGLIVALTSGGSSNANFRSGNRTPAASFDFAGFWAQYGLLVVVGVVLALALILAVSFLSAAAQGGLVAATDRIERAHVVPSFRAAWRLGWRKMVGIWLLNLVVGLLIAIGVLIVALPLIAGGLISATNRVGAFAGGGLFCLMLPLLVLAFCAVLLVRAHAVRALIIEDQRVFQSLGTGWATLRANLGPSIVTALIEIAVGLVMGIVILAIVVLPLAAVIAAGIILQGGQVSLITIVVAIVLGIGWWLFAAAVSAIPTAFSSVIWTELYLKLRGLDRAADFAAGEPLPAV